MYMYIVRILLIHCAASMAMVSPAYPASSRSARFAVLAVFFAVLLLVFRTTMPEQAYVSNRSGIASRGMNTIGELTSVGCPIASNEEVASEDFPVASAGKLHVLVSRVCTGKGGCSRKWLSAGM